MALAGALQRFIDWFWYACLPVWAERGADSGGGFWESLDFAGHPVEREARRVRVQARQIHVFATAARFGRHVRAKDLAAAGFDYFLSRACPDDGRRGCVHRLGPDGSVIDDRRDLYDQAFLLLACAATIRASGDERAAKLAECTFSFLQRELKSAHGGYVEDDRGGLPRRQNPHMHLYEAFHTLHGATGLRQYLERAREIEHLLSSAFFDEKVSALREFFTNDLRPLPDPRGGVVEPGHMVEWVWLLARSERRDLQRTLYRRAAEIGARDGFLVNSIRLGEAPAGPRRLWPQTEYLKASLVMARLGEPGAAETAERLIERLFESYLHQSVNGLWCDEYDGEGNPVARSVPASIVYHLMEAALEAEKHLKEDA